MSESLRCAAALKKALPSERLKIFCKKLLSFCKIEEAEPPPREVKLESYVSRFITCLHHFAMKTHLLGVMFVMLRCAECHLLPAVGVHSASGAAGERSDG